jgi:hypothetical protein
MRNVALVFLIITTVLNGFGQVKLNKTWTNFINYEGIHVEYKFAPCSTQKVNNQILVLFKFVNTTNDKVALTWSEERWVNNICSNCNNIDSEENTRSTILDPNQTIEGDCSTKEFKDRYIFSQFIKLSPGMSKNRITDFKFRNLSKRKL